MQAETCLGKETIGLTECGSRLPAQRARQCGVLRTAPPHRGSRRKRRPARCCAAQVDATPIGARADRSASASLPEIPSRKIKRVIRHAARAFPSSARTFRRASRSFAQMLVCVTFRRASRSFAQLRVCVTFRRASRSFAQMRVCVTFRRASRSFAQLRVCVTFRRASRSFAQLRAQTFSGTSRDVLR